MPVRDTATAWGWPTRLIHWTMAGLILFQLGLGLYMTGIVTDPLKQFPLIQTHKGWGFVIFCLALVRVGWRLAQRTRPVLPSGSPRWQARAARLSHGLLYLLIILMPLSGWIDAAASPVQDVLHMRNMVFGAFPLPDPWVPGVKSIADAAGGVHHVGAIAMLAVLALHAGAALKHHFVDRDAVLARMALGRVGEPTRRRGR